MSVKFSNEKISEHIIRIRDGSDVCEYLVIGTDRAMLIDTGYGIGDLKGYIRTLTDLPLTVYITHGHVDHASGTAAFDDVHMSHYDLELFQKHCNLKFRKEMLKNSGLDLLERDYMPDRKAPFINIKDQETIDLGGVHVVMIHVPGHTKGTFVPLIKEDNIIVFGDASGVGTLICLEGSTTIREYLRSLKYLKTYENQYDMILRQHGTCTSSLSLLNENIENCELILSHKDDHIPTEFMGNTCFWARERDEHGNRLDGKEGNICYQEDNIE